jgi:hypothetical protein
MTNAPTSAKRLRTWLLPWFIAFATLLNAAYPTYRHYDFSHSLDTRTYLSIAQGHFDSTNVTRRYRVLVPWAAAALSVPLRHFQTRIWPSQTAETWPLRLSFYLVNSLLLAIAATCWYQTARFCGALPASALLAMLMVLSSRWAIYAAGLPLTDSLYLVVFGLAYYAHRRGATASWAVAIALIVGPLSKESFFLLVPWMAWYCRPALPILKQALMLTIGTALLFLVHLWVNSRISTLGTSALSNAFGHAQNIAHSLHQIFSLQSLGQLFGVFGLITFFLIVYVVQHKSLAQSSNLQSLIPALNPAEASFIGVIIVHMLLSGDLARMAYLAAPVMVVALAQILERLLTLPNPAFGKHPTPVS